MFDVVMQPSSQMWVVEYVKEGGTPKTPVKGKSFMTHVNNSQTTNGEYDCLYTCTCTCMCIPDGLIQ